MWRQLWMSDQVNGICRDKDQLYQTSQKKSWGQDWLIAKHQSPPLNCQSLPYPTSQCLGHARKLEGRVYSTTTSQPTHNKKHHQIPKDPISCACALSKTRTENHVQIFAFFCWVCKINIAYHVHEDVSNPGVLIVPGFHPRLELHDEALWKTQQWLYVQGTQRSKKKIKQRRPPQLHKFMECRQWVR